MPTIEAAHAVVSTRGTHPVVYQPNGDVIGAASTRRGAIRCAHNIPKLDCEEWSATLAERMIDEGTDPVDFDLAWFVSPILKRK